MGALVEFARRVLKEQSRSESKANEPETAGPLLAVKIGGSVIGDYWLCLSDSEPFDPGDGLPVYQPAEIRALAGKGYGLEALEAINRVRMVFDGKILGH
jgi:hypothetical protein